MGFDFSTCLAMYCIWRYRLSNSTRVGLTCGRIHSSVPHWFIIHTKRCNMRRCFLEITHQRCCYQQNDANDVRGHNIIQVLSGCISILYQIISLPFCAGHFYDAFNAIAMVAANAVSLTVCNCTSVSATVSRNNSDIGTIKIDAYINTRHAQADAITAIHSDELTALMWFDRHRTNPTAIAAHS